MLGTIKDKEYFKKYLSKLSTQELLALMEAIQEYGLEMMNVTGKLGGMKKPKVPENVDVQ